MKKIDWYISDDGKFKGTEQEVKEYEEEQKSPLYGMHFPHYYYSPSIGICWEETTPGNGRYGRAVDLTEAEAIIAFANLAPLIAEWAEWDYGDDLEERKNDRNARGELLRAFDEACKLIPKD